MNLSLSDAPSELLALITKRPSVSKEQMFSFGQSGLSVSDVQSMLGALNPDMDYESWLKVGMALHAEGFGVGLWDSWSAGGTKYREGECEDKWSGFDGSGGVSGGTLVHMAREVGYCTTNAPAAFLGTPKTRFKEAPPIPLCHWSALKKLPSRIYLIKGLLDQGGMSVVYGASNSGKSFFALDISCHISLAWKWCGRKTSKGGVAYIAAEGGLGIAERLEAFRLHHDINDLADLYIIPTNVCLGKDASMHEQLLASLKGVPNLKLIVIDTLARAMGGGDENSPSDMGAFIQNCDAVRQATRAHVMIVHHSGKDQARGARGHSSLKAAVDTEIEISQSSGIVQAVVTKQREGRTDNVFAFEIQPIEIRKDEDGDPVSSCALVPTNAKHNKGQLTGHAREAHQALLNLILESGFEHIPKGGMQSQTCVRLEDFKEHFAKAGIAGTDKPDTIAKAFLRAKNTMKAKGYIAEWDGYIWLTDKPDK